MAEAHIRITGVSPKIQAGGEGEHSPFDPLETSAEIGKPLSIIQLRELVIKGRGWGGSTSVEVPQARTGNRVLNTIGSAISRLSSPLLPEYNVQSPIKCECGEAFDLTYTEI